MLPKTRWGAIGSVACFAQATRRYWSAVFPTVCGEVRLWRARALAAPDPTLRACAAMAVGKRGNLEGAAIFATFSLARRRGHATRAAVAFQAAYNHLDMVGEQPHADAVASVRRLHGALHLALLPGIVHRDYYGPVGGAGDGGLLRAMVDGCRCWLERLPSRRAIVSSACAAAERVIAFQALNLSESNGDHALLERWGDGVSPSGSGLRWWETAAAAGSSLGVHVLIAEAADPTLSAERVAALEGAYFPWIGALHSMLDSLVDVAEDAATGQRNLAVYYDGPRQAAHRMRWLTERCRAEARRLPHGDRHALVLAAMAAHYMSEPEAALPGVSQAREAVLDAAGPAARAALSIFAARRALRPSRRPTIATEEINARAA